MRNKELLKMLTLEKGLVYFTTSLKTNEAYGFVRGANYFGGKK